MVTHRIDPNPRNTHGYFSRELEPVLTVDSGEIVVLSTLDAGWHPDPDPQTGVWDHRLRVDWSDAAVDTGHAMNGPIEIRGAAPGQTLAVDIIDVQPGGWGWTVAGGWQSTQNDRLDVSDGETAAMQWKLNTDSGIATSNSGYSIEMRPFLGVMAVAPDAPGNLATAPPRLSGGNIDCKELIAGTTLYLPIAVEGALFSAGDGHAVQGDGEVSGVAIECPMERVELRLSVAPDVHVTTPRARTADAWITFGFDEDLNEAMFRALESMLDLLGELHGMNRKVALQLASLAVDLRVTQIVNGVRGVHAVLRDGAIM